MEITKHLRFYGGVHPLEGKVTSTSPIETAPLLESYMVPLQQHIGAPATPLVKEGDKVLRGQKIGEPGGFVSASIASPTSGVVKALTTCLAVNGSQIPAVLIESDGEDTPIEPMPILDPVNTAPAVLKKRVVDAGLVGMGGAAFPTAVKLSPNKPVDVLILNGVECEPCLTADHRLMLEQHENIIAGIRVCGTILGVKRIILAIEANKPDAVELMSVEAAKYGIECHQLEVMYPQGSEKQLIYALTGRKVPSGGLPMDVGCVVTNVGTVGAIGRAVCHGIPLYERVTTVTGKPVVHPGNWMFRVGTRYSDAIQLAGGVKYDPVKIISGGPMMGFSVYSLDIPIMKSTSGILLLGEDDIIQYEPNPCLHCGTCNDNCPMGLMPGILSIQIENERFELAEKWHVVDCLECGCCSFGCPAHRPLVQNMRRAKGVVMAKIKAAKAAAAVAAKAAEAAKAEAAAK